MSDEPVSNNLYTGVSDGSGRIHIVTEPALPATCVVCRRSANGAVKFIDFNFSLDYYGAVVLCEDCIKESLSLLDYTPNINFTNKVEELVAAQEELRQVKNERDKYKSVVDSLRIVGVIGNFDGDESKDTDEATGESESADGPSLETESDSDGSDSGGGLKNVSIFAD